MKDSQKAILELIKLLGVSQKEIAEKAGFIPQQFGEWKNGIKNISLENYIHLCKSNGINPDVPLSNIVTNQALENAEKECLKSKKE